jgi:very-short-patch-repair endonuclease
MNDIIEKLNTCEITEEICDITAILNELKISRKDHLVTHLYKYFKENIDYTITKLNFNNKKTRGGHNKLIYKLTDETKDLIKQSYNFRNRYIKEINNIKFVNVIMTLENSTIGFICNSLNNIVKTERQFVVGRYKVDLYIKELNIVIECDENGHNDYDKEKEKKREEIIKKTLNCKFIRYNPNSKDFDLSDVINKILIHYKSKLIHSCG